MGASEEFEFKAETKKLLSIVAHSLYTDKEVFIRELLSNASDACEKLRFLQATSQVRKIHDEKLPLQITVSVDEAARKVVFEDSGCGMTHDELVSSLGTIAKSGSLDFLRSGGSDASKIIGQFGVGFYSSFVVADRVEVYTRTCDAEKADVGYLWESDGAGKYSISEVAGVPRGTRVVLTLKPESAEFSKLATVKEAAKKFSSYIDFPLLVVEDGEAKPLSKQDAVWLKSSVSEEEHTQFFRFLTGSPRDEPYYYFSYMADAPLSIRSCFYIPPPERAPNRMLDRSLECGVALHSRRVLVTKHADGIIPQWLRWVRGVVDCEDMPMNISRESMQDSRLMDKLSVAVVRRILRFLNEQANTSPEKYAKFFSAYGYYLKVGLIEDKESNYGRHKDDIMKLLRFECSQKAAGELVSFEEYVSLAKAGQKNIYYLSCSDRATALSSPFLEQFNLRGRNVLLMYDDIDEFTVGLIAEIQGKKLVSVDASGADLEPDLDKPEAAAASRRELSGAEQKELETFIKGVLEDKVQEVKFTDRLVLSPAVATSAFTPQMRRVLKTMMPGGEGVGLKSAPMTLELNVGHHLVTTLHGILRTNQPVAKMAVEHMFDQACIAAGLLDNPRTILSGLNKVLEMLVYQGAGFDYAKKANIGGEAEPRPPEVK